MATADDTPTPQSLGNRKLAVLGIPWEVDTDGLRQFMSKYGELSDVIVMKDRNSGRSRGFGYVTFATSECAEKVLESSHFLNGRMLDIKVATPKETVVLEDQAPKKKGKRIFVARVPLSITEVAFKSYFQKFGAVADLYMPKDRGSSDHRGIGFVTFEDAESVDKVMAETHQLGGVTVAVDRATPKEKSKVPEKSSESPYGVFNTYLNAAARLGLFGMPPFLPVDFPGYGEMGGAGVQGSGRPQQAPMASEKGPSGFGDHQSESKGYYNRPPAYNPLASLGGMSKPSSAKKIFVGRIPLEVTTDEVRSHFSKFGPLLDVYLPKDKEKTTHRGFAFVTFAEEASVEQVVARSHELRGQLLAIDQAAPMGETVSAGGSAFGSAFYNPSSAAASGGIGGPGPIRGGSLTSSSIAGFGGISAPGGYDYNSPWGLYSSLSNSSAKTEPRYRPY